MIIAVRSVRPIRRADKSPYDSCQSYTLCCQESKKHQHPEVGGCCEPPSHVVYPVETRWWPAGEPGSGEGDLVEECVIKRYCDRATEWAKSLPYDPA